MRAQRLILDLSPSRLALAVVQRSTILRSHEEPLDPSRWDDVWSQDLAPLDAPLAAALAALGCAGRHSKVQLNYRANTVIAEVYASPAEPAAAMDAARLALEAAAPFPLGENASSFVHLHRDGAGDNPQSHVLALADASATLQSLTRWLARAGLTLQRAIPSVAYTIHNALTIALDQPKEQTAAVLLLTGHESVFLAASPSSSSLHFVRQIPVGIESFLAPLTRPLTRPAPQPPLTMTREQAAGYLLRAGIPAFDAQPDEPTSLTSREVLPLLQPALQRLAVEIKQSLRFGLSDAARQTAGLVLAGRAITVPNLEHRLADLSGAVTRTLPADKEHVADGIGRSVGSSLHIPTLATPEAIAKSAARRLVGALYAGSAAASLLLMADTALLSQSLDATRAAAEHAASQVSPLDLPDAAPEARAMAQAVALAAADITAADAQRADWPALLADLSSRLPMGVRATSVVATSDDHVAIVDTAITHSDAVSAPLQDAIAALKASPMVRSVELGPTARDPDTGHLRVSLRVTSWPIPRQPLTSAALTP